MKNGKNHKNKFIQDKHHREQTAKIINQISVIPFLQECKTTKGSCSLSITVQEIQMFGKKTNTKTVLQNKQIQK